MFHNLARNAIEAMPEGGKLRVAVDRDGDELVLDGRPTPARASRPSCSGRLFELFATGKKGGTGLGLAIVKKIVDDHRGIDRVRERPARHDVHDPAPDPAKHRYGLAL